MHDLLREAASLAAARSLADLALSTFGAIDELELMEIAELSDNEGGAYWVVSWEARSTGLTQATVSMVILPEFLEGDNAEPGWLAEQMTALIRDRVTTAMEEDLAGDGDDEDEAPA